MYTGPLVCSAACGGPWEVLDGCDAAGLEVSADGRRVIGLRVLPRAEGAAAQVLDADLVVDASGWGSRTPVWLERLGYPRPVRDEVQVGVAYASRRYRIDPDVLREQGGVGISNGTLPRPYGGGFQFVEHGQMVVTLGGYAGNHPPVDAEGFVAFAARLPAGLHDIIQRGEPVGDPVAKIVDRAWEISVTGDLRLPRVVGRRTLKVRLINAYLPLLHAAAAVDSRVGAAFLRVSNLLDAPPSRCTPSAGPPRG